MALIPLRIPMGFAVCYNSFEDVDPGLIGEDGLLTNWEYFKEDILQIQRMQLNKGTWEIPKENKLIIDLGWYPDSDPQGFYRLVLTNERGDELYAKETKDRFEIKDAIEGLMGQINRGEF